MIKSCQLLRLYNSANSCEKCLFPSLFLSLIAYFCPLFVDRTTGRQDCREIVPAVCTCLFVSLFGGGERRKPDGRNLSPPTQNLLF